MYRIYQIRMGDTLDNILKMFSTDEETLKKINGVNEIRMIPGSYLIVPAPQDNLFTYYKVEKGDTLYSIASKYNTTVQDLALLNGLNTDDYLYINQELVVPNDNVHFYMTKEGDTLSNVSKELNSPTEILVRQNEEIYLLPEQMLIYKEER